ncbi:inosine/xanthosine triphosphatase [Haloarcula pellucida]|uniref:inosine/xanthosine triphosphatase n=1 Tax=Haloarcula pellucida TaxID=1427151 RepID=A0A830GF64_9EURY|nr:inosine/xanthosine triphosphatase [Halomicroarcula pellucida]MBX0346728.1 inosine/xanthosine triphosphatase [Halomicroarcula pellucida]GGN85223.1 NTPase [Halomicroarcula pellucida]
MDVAVGSENPVKRTAVERILPDATVVSVGVDSGVAEQPWGREETATGARNRATAALSDTDADFGVGIEGGVADRTEPEGLWLVMWAAVTDGETTAFGDGPSIRLPAAVAGRVRDGEELGPVLDDRLGREAVAKREGAVGVYTDGRVTRTDALADAVAGAFGLFLTDRYDSR